MRSFSRVALALGATLLPLSGCQFIRPVPQQDARTMSAVTASTGEDIAFRSKAGPVDESDARPGGTLTLSDAVKLALSNDARIQAALSRVRMAQAEALQTRLLPNPIVSVAFRFPDTGSTIIEASLAQEFLSLLTKPGRISAADNRLRAESAAAVVEVLDVVAEVKERYAAIQALEALTPVLKERQRLVTRLLELANARLKAGEGTRLDVTTVDAQRVEIEVEIAEKERELRSERLALTRLIGQPSGAATWPVTSFEEPVALATREADWVATALEHRPEIAARRWELAALGIEARLTRFAPFEGSGVGVDSERDDGWSVGPSLSAPLPLFDWGQGQRAKALAARTAAGHALTQARREVVQEARQAHGDYAASLSALRRVRTELVPLEESRRSQAEAAYKAGQADITSLIIADQELQAARAKLIELQQRVSESLARLERAAGGPARVPPPQQPTTNSATSSQASADTQN